MRHDSILSREPVAENEDEVVAALAKRLKRRGAARELAELMGASEAYVSQCRRRKTVPAKLAYLLGYRRVVRWEKM
jgi:hypothetical protein